MWLSRLVESKIFPLSILFAVYFIVENLFIVAKNRSKTRKEKKITVLIMIIVAF